MLYVAALQHQLIPHLAALLTENTSTEPELVTKTVQTREHIAKSISLHFTGLSLIFSVSEMLAILDFMSTYLQYKFLVVLMLFLNPKNLYLATKTTILSQLVNILRNFH